MAFAVVFVAEFAFDAVLATVFAAAFVFVTILLRSFVFAITATFDGRLLAFVKTLASVAALVLVTLALASVAGVASVGVSSATVSRTETPPLSAGIANIRADSIKIVAAAIVIFDKIVCEPRG